MAAESLEQVVDRCLEVLGPIESLTTDVTIGRQTLRRLVTAAQDAARVREQADDLIRIAELLWGPGTRRIGEARERVRELLCERDETRAELEHLNRAYTRELDSLSQRHNAVVDNYELRLRQLMDPIVRAKMMEPPPPIILQGGDLHTENAALRAALEPFGRFKIHSSVPDSWSAKHILGPITVGQLRAAAAALAAKGERP